MWLSNSFALSWFSMFFVGPRRHSPGGDAEDASGADLGASSVSAAPLLAARGRALSRRPTLAAYPPSFGRPRTRPAVVPILDGGCFVHDRHTYSASTMPGKLARNLISRKARRATDMTLFLLLEPQTATRKTNEWRLCGRFIRLVSADTETARDDSTWHRN